LKKYDVDFERQKIKNVWPYGAIENVIEALHNLQAPG